MSKTGFRLQVTTAKTTAGVDFTSHINDLGNEVNDVWYGTAELDGTKGAEIMVSRLGSHRNDLQPRSPCGFDIDDLSQVERCGRPLGTIETLHAFTGEGHQLSADHPQCS